MWMPLLLRFSVKTGSHRALWQATQGSHATCKLYIRGCHAVTRNATLLCQNLGLMKTQLSFLPLVQPCCARAYSTENGKSTQDTATQQSSDQSNTTQKSSVQDTPTQQGSDQDKTAPQKKKLTEEEFAALEQLFNQTIRTHMPDIKKKNSQNYFFYTENNYMSIKDAKDQYLLTDKDLINLKKFKRSSPYDGESNLTGEQFIEVALSKEIMKIAVRKWGSIEKIAIERRRNEYFDGSSPFRQIRKIQAFSATFKEAFGKENGMVVMMALIMNMVNAGCKMYILMMTGSSSVFSELIHSLADIMNQVALAIAKFLSLKRPDIDHPYGYGNFQPIVSIFCGVMFFSMGFGVSMYNAVQGLMYPTSITAGSLITVAQLLSVTLVTESASLAVAVKQGMKDAKKSGLSFYQYVKMAEDPLVNVVLLEDLVGVLGVVVCGAAVGASIYFGQPYIDAFGSMTIGVMMAGVSAVLLKTSSDILLGKSLWYQDKVKKVIENDRMVNAVFDHKTIDMGDQSRLKTEIVLDAREVTRHLLDTVDVDAMLVKWKSVETVEDMERFLETFGVEIYDEIVQHIDRIEQEVKKKFPEIRHIDIEPS